MTLYGSIFSGYISHDGNLVVDGSYIEGEGEGEGDIEGEGEIEEDSVVELFYSKEDEIDEVHVKNLIFLIRIICKKTT